MLMPLDVCNVVRGYLGSTSDQLYVVMHRQYLEMEDLQYVERLMWMRRHGLLRDNFHGSAELQGMQSLAVRLWNVYTRRRDAERRVKLQ